MAIINLEQIPIPPAGFPVTRQQQTQFVNNYMKLSAPTLDEQDRLTIRILGLIYSLNALKGVNYKNNHAQLVADAAAYTNGVSMLSPQIALGAIEWSNGNKVDATLSTNVEALCQEGRDFEQYPPDTLYRIITMLEIRLSQ